MTRKQFHIKILLYSFLLLSCFIARAQTPVAEEVQKDYRQYLTGNIQEKIFVHTAKTFYLAGETIWFTVYDLDASRHTPLTLSSVAYAEILNKDQQPVMQARIGLGDGKGAGSFSLPSNLPSGNYLLRCYTAWMKNFSPNLFFRQEITIVNTFRNAGPVEAAGPILSVHFFPEGGNLVFGLRSKVAFQFTGKKSLTENSIGYLLDQKKDTILQFRPGKMGTGSFLLTPLPGNSYEAHIVAADTTITEKFPASYNNGYVMHLAEQSVDKLKITVQTTPSSADPLLYLLVHTRRQSHEIQVSGFANNEASFYIDKNTLDDGISWFTIFDSRKAPVCERLYFRRPRNTMDIEAQLTQPSYGKRKKADVLLTTIAPPDPEQHGILSSTPSLNAGNPSSSTPVPVKASLSLSVFRIDSLQDLPTQDIVSYLLLSSELKGHIPSPRHYLEDTTAQASEDLDNLLLTQGWSRFRWEEVLQHKKTNFEFLPESNGSLITGHLIDKRTGSPAPPTIGYLSAPGRSFVFSVAQSRQDGSIHFDTRNFYTDRDLVVQTNSQTVDSNYRIDIASPFSAKSTDFRLSSFSINPATASLLLSGSIEMQAENSYRIHEKRRFKPMPEEDSIAFYGKGDHTYFLDEYTRFQTLEEVMREYIQEVHVRQQSGKFYYRVKNNLFNLFFEDAPLVLIDGVPAFEMNKMLAVDPLKIKKIEMVARKFYTGPLIDDGIVSYRTYEGDLGGFQLDPNAIAVHYEGLQLQREFYTPPYDKESPPASVPDFRNLLQWIPDLDTTPEGKSNCSFYTSDLPGNYIIFIQGITNHGQPGSKIVSFTVK